MVSKILIGFKDIIWFQRYYLVSKISRTFNTSNASKNFLARMKKFSFGIKDVICTKDIKWCQRY